jgi:hypothetical protein
MMLVPSGSGVPPLLLFAIWLASCLQLGLSAYLDDVLCGGQRGLSAAATHHLVAELPTVGLVPNLSKSFVYGSEPVPPGAP